MERWWEKEHPDFLVMFCPDGRQASLVEERFAPEGIFDHYARPGGCLSLIDPDRRDGVLKELEVLVEAHKLKRIVAVNHCDCAAYGWQFADEEQEVEFHANELLLAAQVLHRNFPGVRVTLYVLGRGSWHHIATTEREAVTV